MTGLARPLILASMIATTAAAVAERAPVVYISDAVRMNMVCCVVMQKRGLCDQVRRGHYISQTRVLSQQHNEPAYQE
jgi:hypothetical protein